MGVKFQRLLCAGVSVIEHRQINGLDMILENAQKLRSQSRLQADEIEGLTMTGGSTKKIYNNYTHAWDEVNLKFMPAPRSKSSGQDWMRMAFKLASQTIVQRGIVTTTMVDETENISSTSTEPWLVKVKEVESTSAEALNPAVRDGLPPQFDIYDVPKMRSLLEKSDGFTVTFVPDKGSGNILLVKKAFSYIWNTLLPAVGPRVRGMCETCNSHGEHRTKLEVKPLKGHTMMHFKIAGLNKLWSNRNGLCAEVERRCVQVRRRVGPRPDGPPIHSLYVYVDILFDFNAEHHKRKGGMSQLWTDLQELCRLVTWDLCASSSSEAWLHDCWDPERQKPCCQNARDTRGKLGSTAARTMYGHTDPTPAESTWTHVLQAFRMTLLRAGLDYIGIDSIHVLGEGADLASDTAVSGDGEAASDYYVKMNGFRLKATNGYYQKRLACPPAKAWERPVPPLTE